MPILYYLGSLVSIWTHLLINLYSQLTHYDGISHLHLLKIKTNSIRIWYIYWGPFWRCLSISSSTAILSVSSDICKKGGGGESYLASFCFGIEHLVKCSSRIWKSSPLKCQFITFACFLKFHLFVSWYELFIYGGLLIKKLFSVTSKRTF